VYLDERRAEQVAVDFTHTSNIWVLTSLHLNHIIVRSNKSDAHPTIAIIIDRLQNQVIAWRSISPDRTDTTRALAFYDALSLQREPAQRAPVGLRWTVPERLYVMGDMPPGLDLICDELGIELEVMDMQLPLISAIESSWAGQAMTTFTEQQFQLTFDTYLHRLHGFGPLRMRRQKNHEFTHLLGYNRDPAWQFPALRSILPAHQATINHQGEVEFDGLHFQDELLRLFPNTSIMLRQSEHSEATAWIDLDGEILCEAKAHELRRADGTYRAYRPVGASRLNV
jgi:hypothetical protein